MQVVVYGSKSPRLSYLIEVFCTDYFGFQWQIIEDKSAFIKSSGFKINYSRQDLPDCVNIPTSGFMEEQELRKFFPTYLKQERHHALFPMAGDPGFDLFSAVFYILSRYEEYVTEERDSHNRFTAKQSMAFHNGFLGRPVVDEWMELLKTILEKHHNMPFPETVPESKIIPTFDLDNAFAFVGKGMGRNLAGLTRDLVRGRIVWVKRRMSTWRNKNNDPYNTYDYILDKVKDQKAVFFLPLGRRGPFDKNVYWKDNNFKNLISKIRKSHQLGIHPSYNSNYLNSILETEVKRFRKLTKSELTRSRQHYLKLNLPDTYHNLIHHGIKHDYTMGYADLPGFRAGIARPYIWYDLSSESTSTLTVHPFMYMDGTFNDYMKIEPTAALERMQILKQQTKAFNGEFVFIWHNDSLRDTDNWTGWRSLFEASLTWD